jgi:hypothetical protein
MDFVDKSRHLCLFRGAKRLGTIANDVVGVIALFDGPISAAGATAPCGRFVLAVDVTSLK